MLYACFGKVLGLKPGTDRFMYVFETDVVILNRTQPAVLRSLRFHFTTYITSPHTLEIGITSLVVVVVVVVVLIPVAERSKA